MLMRTVMIHCSGLRARTAMRSASATQSVAVGFMEAVERAGR